MGIRIKRVRVPFMSTKNHVAESNFVTERWGGEPYEGENRKYGSEGGKSLIIVPLPLS